MVLLTGSSSSSDSSSTNSYVRSTVKISVPDSMTAIYWQPVVIFSTVNLLQLHPPSVFFIILPSVNTPHFQNE